MRTAYVILVLGVVLDQLTTWTALLLGHPEANPSTRYMIAEGIWLAVDLGVLLLGLMVPWTVEKVTGYRALYAFPLTLGSLRLLCAVVNLRILSNT